MELLQRKPAVVRAPTDGEKIAPTPSRNAILGVFVGVLLGLAIALVWDALDKRVRDVDEIVAALGLLLIGRVPTPRQKAEGSELPMLREPAAREAESFRRLRANFEFANLDIKAKVVMITSAVGDEGKSQTLANLAIALARGGRRVALVDLDLRKPTLGRYFRLELRPGITDVVIGRIPLDQGLVLIPLDVDEHGVSTAPAVPVSAGYGAARVRSFSGQRGGVNRGVGELAVLPAGFPPANPGEFVGTQAVAGILTQLRDEMDLVLVDAPPLLPVSDAAALSRHVDAMLVVTRLGLVNRPMLKEFSRDVAACPAYKLGLIITGGDAPEHYGETYGYGVSATSRALKRTAVPLRGAPAVAAEEVLPALEGQRGSTSHTL